MIWAYSVYENVSKVDFQRILVTVVPFYDWET